MIKLVVCDIDGTLIGRDEIVSEKAIYLSKLLAEKGILFTVATGRTNELAKEIIKKLGISIPYILTNGAVIRYGNNIYRKNTIDLVGLKNIIDKSKSLGMSLVISIDGEEYVLEETDWILDQQIRFNRYHKMANLDDGSFSKVKIEKLMIMDSDRNGDILKLEKLAINLPQTYTFTRYTNKSIEIVSRDSNKATALLELCHILDINMEDVLSIGDHINDIEMIKEAGIGCAVANALNEVKEIADYTSKYEQIDGVIDIVEKFLKL